MVATKDASVSQRPTATRSQDCQHGLTVPENSAQAHQPLARSPGLSEVETHSIDFIPESERHGNVKQQTLFWIIANFNIFSVSLGLLGPSLGLSLMWSIIGGAAGGIFGGFFVSFHASQGPTFGLPQMIQSRAQFGYRGVLVPTVAVLFNFIVFNIMQTSVIESGLNGVFGWTPYIVVLAVSVAAALLAIYGHDWLHLTFRAIFWCCAPFYLLLTIGIISGHAGGQMPTSPGDFHLTAFVAIFATAMSYNLTLAPYVSDYTRYLPSTTKTAHVVFAVQAGICLSLIWLMSIGAWLASRTGATDALVGLDAAGNHMFLHFGTLTAILSVIGLVAVIGMNTYSAGIAIATLLDCFSPVKPTKKLRILSTILLLLVWGTVNLNLHTDQSTLINNLLNCLLYLLVPWTAVNLIDFFIVRKGQYAIAEIEKRDGIYGLWAWRGLAAYAVGLVAEAPFMVLSFYKGPVAHLMDDIDVAFAVGLIVSAGVYLLLCRNLDMTSEQAAIDRENLPAV